MGVRQIQTKYRHLYNADGSLRKQPCTGYLAINCGDDGVYVSCAECGESYEFEFLMPDSMASSIKREHGD
jgi:hypothetical protein